MEKRFAYENPAIFDFQPPKKEKNPAEEMRKETLKEMGKEKPFIQKHFFAILAAIILIIFLVIFLFFGH